MKIKSGPCWVDPNRSLDGKGYTQVNQKGREKSGHREAYRLLVGPIPEGLEIDHLCRDTRCYNPAHLEPVTHRENTRRSKAATKTHCKRGHELKGYNLYLNPRTGHRSCRVCRQAQSAACNERKRNAQR